MVDRLFFDIITKVRRVLIRWQPAQSYDNGLISLRSPDTAMYIDNKTRLTIIQNLKV